MAADETFRVRIDQLRDYEFRVAFEGLDVADLDVDEPEPLGRGSGPNPSRLVAAAVGNCLAASLLFCLRKSRVEPRKVAATVDGRMTRNEQGRLRIGGLHVRLAVDVPGSEPARLGRCLALFEDYCVVTESLRHGVPVEVEVVDGEGRAVPFERSAPAAGRSGGETA